MTRDLHPQIVHEGRGGYIAIAECRYVIEHVQDGQFCIYFPSGNRPRDRDLHLAALEQLCRDEPAKWRIVRRDRRARRDQEP
jgi:hypothetical protein